MKQDSNDSEPMNKTKTMLLASAMLLAAPAWAQDSGRNIWPDQRPAEGTVEKGKMKQGVGRLIRNEEDKGIVMILDGRIIRKGYRHTMFTSLPEGYYPDDTMVENISSKIENFLY